MSLTEDESITLVELLSKCELGNLPSNVFEAVGRVSVYPAIEFILLKESENGIKTLLFQRSSDDPVWPNQFHTPGTVLRPTDTSLDDAIKRLINEELKNLELSKPQLSAININKYSRGASLGIEYWLEVGSQPYYGTLFNVDNLPKNFIDDQKPMLNRAVNAFLSHKNKTRVL